MSGRKPEDGNYRFEDRLNVLVSALIDATRRNRLFWKSDRDTDSSSYEFNGAHSFSCFRSGVTIHTCDSFLVIRNESGQAIVNDFHESFRELYVEARAVAMSSDEVIEGLLKELDKL